MKTLRSILALLLVTSSLALTLLHSQYGYSAWASKHYPGQPCALIRYTCQETGTLPTKDQRIAWSSYVYFVDCYQNQNGSACQELEN